MGLDVVIAVTFYWFCIAVKGFSGHPNSTWTRVRIAFQVFHRAFIVYVTLIEASNWRNEHPTAMMKDWLEDDMAYAIYLPVLVLELLDASVRIGVSVKQKDYKVPSVKAFLLRCVPDFVVAASLIFLSLTISKFLK